MNSPKTAVAEQTKRSQRPFEAARYRRDFQILARKIYGKPLVYFDNAATAQKPACVIHSLKEYYETENANIHRGVFYLSEKATARYEAARKKVQTFINAPSEKQILFVRGATEGINLIASSYGRFFLNEGDEIILTELEHHSNIVPWQILRDEIGVKLRVAPINDAGELVLEEFEKLFHPKTKLVAVSHVSNALGTVNPVRQMIRTAHRFGAAVLVDGAQAVPHLRVDVQDLDCEFYVFSAHKMYGPTGVGVVYGKADLLERMPPYQGGGDMISSVTFEKTTYNVLPHKFEAGTPNIAGAIGLGEAVDYLNSIGLERIKDWEDELLKYATERLSTIQGLRIVGTAPEKAAVISFVYDDVHPHDIGTVLDSEGVAIRAGHHCAMPLMERLGLPATARASFAFYNTKEEVDSLVRALHKVRGIFG